MGLTSDFWQLKYYYYDVHIGWQKLNDVTPAPWWLHFRILCMWLLCRRGLTAEWRCRTILLQNRVDFLICITYTPSRIFWTARNIYGVWSQMKPQNASSWMSSDAPVTPNGCNYTKTLARPWNAKGVKILRWGRGFYWFTSPRNMMNPGSLCYMCRLCYAGYRSRDSAYASWGVNSCRALLPNLAARLPNMDTAQC